MNNILVTGGSGVLGNNLLRYLLNKYDDRNIISYSKNGYADNPKSLESITDHCRFVIVKGDINNPLLFHMTLKENAVGTVINLAASTHVDRSFIYPEEFMECNDYGTFNVLQAIRLLRKKPLLIQMSTDEVFGYVEKGFCREPDRLEPRNP